MITIKEYAKQCGKTPQAVYKQLRTEKNKKKLAGHIQIIEGKKFLDDVAVSILDESRDNAVVVYQENTNEELKAVKAENENLKSLVIKLQTELLEDKRLLLDAQTREIDAQKAIEDRNELREKVEELQKKYSDQGEELRKEQEKTWIDKLFKR